MSGCIWIALLQAAVPVGSDVNGRIVLKTGTLEGTIDIRGGGLRGGAGAGVLVIEGKVPIAKDYGVCSWDHDKGLRLHSRNLPPGWRLITVAWKKRLPPNERLETREITHYMDWAWVEVKASDAKATVVETVLTVEPSVNGDAEVVLAPGFEADSVSFIPADAQGRIPDWSERRTGAAYTEKVVDGKAVFRGMRPGSYAFFSSYDPIDTGAPMVFVTTTVPAQAVTKVTLGDGTK